MDNVVIAVPKGRILKELRPLMEKAGIHPEADFDDPQCRRLEFTTQDGKIRIIRVRSFDVATFVAFGAAQLGVAGSDVLTEFGYTNLYAPVDLGIGGCRISVAGPRQLVEKDDPRRWSHVRVATKYPEITRRYFADRGVQAECIKLHGAMELAPSLGLCRRIVDLVSSGKTLQENGMKEYETIMTSSAHLIVNRPAYKTRTSEIAEQIEKFRKAANA